MKVLKAGRKQTGWSRKCKCTGNGNGGGGCGAELLVEQGDIYLTHSFERDGDGDTYNTFRCAACGVETDLPLSVHLPFSPPSKQRTGR